MTATETLTPTRLTETRDLISPAEGLVPTVERLRPLLINSHVKRSNLSREEVEDALHEATLYMVVKHPTLRGQDAERMLSTVMNGKVTDMVRQNARRAFDSLEVLAESGSDAVDHDADFRMEQVLARVSLESERDREILTLALPGLTDRDIAEVLDISKTTAHRSIVRIREAFLA